MGVAGNFFCKINSVNTNKWSDENKIKYMNRMEPQVKWMFLRLVSYAVRPLVVGCRLNDVCVLSHLLLLSVVLKTFLLLLCAIRHMYVVCIVFVDGIDGSEQQQHQRV